MKIILLNTTCKFHKGLFATAYFLPYSKIQWKHPIWIFDEGTRAMLTFICAALYYQSFMQNVSEYYNTHEPLWLLLWGKGQPAVENIKHFTVIGNKTAHHSSKNDSLNTILNSDWMRFTAVLPGSCSFKVVHTLSWLFLPAGFHVHLHLEHVSYRTLSIKIKWDFCFLNTACPNFSHFATLWWSSL